MPHGAMDESCVDAAYAILDELLHKAQAKQCRVLVGGDFNAEVGPRATEKDFDIMGENNIRSRNERGD
eukprot:2612219-Pyramimonas_sp.AAC.1